LALVLGDAYVDLLFRQVEDIRHFAANLGDGQPFDARPTGRTKVNAAVHANLTRPTVTWPSIDADVKYIRTINPIVTGDIALLARGLMVAFAGPVDAQPVVSAPYQRSDQKAAPEPFAPSFQEIRFQNSAHPMYHRLT